MRKVITIAVVCICVDNAAAQGQVEANINNLKSSRGVCRVCMFNSAASFKGEAGQPYQCVSVPANNKTAKALFANTPAGNYAIMVFHDVRDH